VTADKKQDMVLKRCRQHLSNAYMRQQKAAIDREGGPTYEPAILEVVDENYVAQTEEWEDESEEEVVSSVDDKEWRPRT